MVYNLKMQMVVFPDATWISVNIIIEFILDFTQKCVLNVKTIIESFFYNIETERFL